MIQSMWMFVIVSLVFMVIFFLRPPWTLENVIIGGSLLVMAVFFGYRIWRAKKEQADDPPED